VRSALGKAEAAAGSRVEKGGLTVSEYAVLGLLGFGETSGYELARFAERSVGFIWAPAKSQIYKVLPRLAASGLAVARVVLQRQAPDKRLYRLSPAGRKVLRAWLASVEETEPADVTLLKIFFAGQGPAAALPRQLAAYRASTASLLGSYEELERRLPRTDQNELPLQVLQLGLARERASLAWADKLLHLLTNDG
jgi:DNA-binding PadR family transcriptional regulator